MTSIKLIKDSSVIFTSECQVDYWLSLGFHKEGEEPVKPVPTQVIKKTRGVK